jgi:hypothetical protein
LREISFGTNRNPPDNTAKPSDNSKLLRFRVGREKIILPLIKALEKVPVNGLSRIIPMYEGYLDEERR